MVLTEEPRNLISVCTKKATERDDRAARCAVLAYSNRRARPTLTPGLLYRQRDAIVRATRVDDGVSLRNLRADGTAIEATYEYVLAATGREPDVDALGLANTSIELG